jgi:hypothetical protein
MHILNKMLKYDYILIYWLVVVKGTNIFQELVHTDVKNMSVKAVGNKNVTVCNTLHVLMYEFLENVGPFEDNEPINEYVIIFQHFIQYVHFSVKCT